MNKETIDDFALHILCLAEKHEFERMDNFIKDIRELFGQKYVDVIWERIVQLRCNHAG